MGTGVTATAPLDPLDLLLGLDHQDVLNRQTADGVAHQVKLLVAQGVGQPIHVGSDLGAVVPPLQAHGAAVPPEIGERESLRIQKGAQGIPGPDRAEELVEHDHRRARASSRR